MPYYKGVYFEKAFHTEKDVVQHATENPVEASEPAVLPAAQAPVLAEELPPVSEPGLAVAVPDGAFEVEPDPFPKFEAEAEPETQPAPTEDPAETPAEAPNAKKKKKSDRSGG